MPSGDEAQLFAPANSLSVRSQAATVQPVVGVVQEVRGNSKEKKDLGILGMTAPPLSLYGIHAEIFAYCPGHG